MRVRLGWTAFNGDIYGVYNSKGELTEIVDSDGERFTEFIFDTETGFKAYQII